jgi:hypothetical protein
MAEKQKKLSAKVTGQIDAMDALANEINDELVSAIGDKQSRNRRVFGLFIALLIRLGGLAKAHGRKDYAQTVKNASSRWLDGAASKARTVQNLPADAKRKEIDGFDSVKVAYSNCVTVLTKGTTAVIEAVAAGTIGLEKAAAEIRKSERGDADDLAKVRLGKATAAQIGEWLAYGVESATGFLTVAIGAVLGNSEVSRTTLYAIATAMQQAVAKDTPAVAEQAERDAAALLEQMLAAMAAEAEAEAAGVPSEVTLPQSAEEKAKESGEVLGATADEKAEAAKAKRQARHARAIAEIDKAEAVAK